MSVYERLGVPTVINAKGTATRLSGGYMHPSVVEAMAEASAFSVDMAHLQAAASRRIAALTGAEAGYVASGASACLLLATAACIAGSDPARMARLPDTRGMAREVIMMRSQRNGYDHAIRAAGATIVEVGLPDRHAGSGVRDAEVWEIAAAITGDTAAIFYVADREALPPLPQVTALARERGIPVIVDAAAQIPPRSNLTRFIAEGADLVAFSGGKVLGGPQASGFLCGRRDLIMSAALQHLDLDVHADLWRPPADLIDPSRLAGIPQHGIGRSSKVGKEEIVGLLTALDRFAAETDATRHAVWLGRLRAIVEAVQADARMVLGVVHESDDSRIPELVVSPSDPSTSITPIIVALLDGTPAVHVDAAQRRLNRLVINPVCLKDKDVAALARALRRAFDETGGGRP